MSSYARLVDRLFNTPLLVTPEKADAIAVVLNNYLAGTAAELPKYEGKADAPEVVALSSSMSVRRTEGGYYLTTSGVAMVRVHGSLVQRAGGLDTMSGLTGYNALAGVIGTALRDPVVRGIVLEIDSPGGEVAGVMELASLIAGAEKPVYAHANELAASAAYWLAAAADKVYAPTTGLLGSIGVLMLHADRSKQHERAGVVYTPIFAGARKVDGSSMAPLSDEARAWAEARIGQVYGLFVEHVAAHRGISAKKVRDTEAAVLSVQEATTKKLADGVATLGDTIQMMTDELNAGRSKRKSYGRAAAHAHPDQEQTMEKDDDKSAAPKQPAAITPEQLAAARAEGVAEGQTKARAEAELAAKAASDATIARIKAIKGCDAAKDRPVLAEKVAMETSMSVEEAQKFMADLPKETVGGKLDASMPRNPNIGADHDGGAGGNGAAAGIDSGSIYGDRRAQTIHAVK